MGKLEQGQPVSKVVALSRLLYLSSTTLSKTMGVLIWPPPRST